MTLSRNVHADVLRNRPLRYTTHLLQNLGEEEEGYQCPEEKDETYQLASLEESTKSVVGISEAIRSHANMRRYTQPCRKHALAPTCVI